MGVMATNWREWRLLQNTPYFGFGNLAILMLEDDKITGKAVK